MKKLVYLSTIFLFCSCKQNKCEYIITLDSGEVIAGVYVQNFVSGVSNIKKCDGDNFQVHTSDIKEIKQNK
jgi:hypothetical protein